MLNLAAPDSGISTFEQWKIWLNNLILDPKIHWDPDVIGALDDEEFDYDADENALDDDFMLQANGIQPLADDECDEFE